MGHTLSTVARGMKAFEVLKSLDSGNTYSQEISDDIDMPQSDVSKLLNIMEDAELLESERVGGRVDYSITGKGQKYLELKKKEKDLKQKAESLVLKENPDIGSILAWEDRVE